MSDLVGDWPVWFVFIAFWCGAMMRSNGTYWIGRGLRAGGHRTRLAAQLDRPSVGRAEAFVGRWGAAAVALGFLTVGVQTLINAAAGVLHMPLVRFVPATAVGSLMWAALYTSAGVAIWEAVATGSWWLLLVVPAVVGLVAATTHWLSRVLATRRGGR